MSDETLIDYDWRAIRIAQVRPDGFVAFDFYVGDPDIYAEMVLPEAAFYKFCAAQGVEPIGPEEPIIGADGLGFTLREAAARAANAANFGGISATQRGPHHAA